MQSPRSSSSSSSSSSSFSSFSSFSSLFLFLSVPRVRETSSFLSSPHHHLHPSPSHLPLSLPHLLSLFVSFLGLLRHVVLVMVTKAFLLCRRVRETRACSHPALSPLHPPLLFRILLAPLHLPSSWVCLERLPPLCLDGDFTSPHLHLLRGRSITRTKLICRPPLSLLLFVVAVVKKWLAARLMSNLK